MPISVNKIPTSDNIEIHAPYRLSMDVYALMDFGLDCIELNASRLVKSVVPGNLYIPDDI